jgi:putative PIN family toxin of toxin-antitoxin system
MQSKASPKAVLDSVVLVSAFLTKGLASEVLALCATSSELYTAEEILQEVRCVLLEKEHIRSRYIYSDADVEAFVSGLQEIFIIVGPLPQLQVVARDPKDDMIIACALLAKADYIVSRDIHLLDLREYQGIQIVPPEDFVHHLRKNGKP